VLGRSFFPSSHGRALLLAELFHTLNFHTNTKLESLTRRLSVVDTMATIETDPEPPYAVQTDGPARSEYMSIPFHSCKQNMSFEELHLEHYNTCHKQSLSDLDDASELMATQWLSSRRLNSPMQPIRAVADGTQKYVTTEVHLQALLLTITAG